LGRRFGHTIPRYVYIAVFLFSFSFLIDIAIDFCSYCFSWQHAVHIPCKYRACFSNTNNSQTPNQHVLLDMQLATADADFSSMQELSETLEGLAVTDATELSTDVDGRGPGHINMANQRPRRPYFLPSQDSNIFRAF
jgi:hypothetical protein